MSYTTWNDFGAFDKRIDLVLWKVTRKADGTRFYVVDQLWFGARAIAAQYMKTSLDEIMQQAEVAREEGETPLKRHEIVLRKDPKGGFASFKTARATDCATVLRGDSLEVRRRVGREGGCEEQKVSDREQENGQKTVHSSIGHATATHSSGAQGGEATRVGVRVRKDEVLVVDVTRLRQPKERGGRKGR